MDRLRPALAAIIGLVAGFDLAHVWTIDTSKNAALFTGVLIAGGAILAALLNGYVQTRHRENAALAEECTHTIDHLMEGLGGFSALMHSLFDIFSDPGEGEEKTRVARLRVAKSLADSATQRARIHALGTDEMRDAAMLVENAVGGLFNRLGGGNVGVVDVTPHSKAAQDGVKSLYDLTRDHITRLRKRRDAALQPSVWSLLQRRMTPDR